MLIDWLRNWLSRLKKSRTPYEKVLALWWEEHKLKLKQSTAYRTGEAMRVHVVPWFVGIPVRKIRARDIQKYADYKLQHGSALRHPDGLSVESVKKHLAIIRMSLRWAVENGYIKKNPYPARVNLPTHRSPEIKVFTPEEIDALLEVVKQDWLRDAIQLAFLTGMRRGEVFGLKFSDIDLDGKFLTVRRSAVAVSQNILFIGTPKTKASRRRIMLDDAAIEILKRRKETAQSDWVFAGKDGGPMNPWYVPLKMREACDAANIPRRTFHALRHSHATFLLSMGIHPKIVQERLGHSRIVTTLDTYSHVIPTMQGVAVEAMNQRNRKVA